MEQIEKDFVQGLLNLKTKADEFDKLENQKRSTVETAMSVLSPEKKEKLRSMFSERQPTEGNSKRKGAIRLVDSKGKEHEKMFAKRGQEHSIDTFGATRKKRGLSGEDLKQVGLAMSEIVEMTRMALDKKGPDGKPLFNDADELEREIFTPLVREGILPENFVLDQFSEVQKLLKNAFQSYQETNQEARDEERQKAAKSSANRAGAGSGLDRFKDTMKYLASTHKRLIDEDKLKWGKFIVNSGVAVKDMISAGFMVDKWAQFDAETGQSKIVERYDMWLNPESDGVHTDDELRVIQEQNRREFKVAKFCKLMGMSETDKKNIVTLLNVQDEDGYFYTMEALDIVFNQLILQGVDFATEGKALDDLRNALKSPHHDSKKLLVAQAAAREIDAILVGELDKAIRKGVGAAVKDGYYKSLDMQGLSDSIARTEPDHAEVLGILASGFPLALNNALAPELLSVGGDIAQAFVKSANGKALVKDLAKDPTQAFKPVVQAAQNAISQVLGQLDKELIKTADKAVLTGAVTALAMKLDKGISEVLAKHNKESGAAFEGLIQPHVNVSTIVNAAAEKPPKADVLIKAIQDGIREAFVFAAPNPTDKTFKSTGTAVADAVKSALEELALGSKLSGDVATTFKAILDASIKAAADALAKQTNFIQLIQSKETAQALCAKSVFPDGGTEMMEELEKADQELADYERQLVLIDEGGVAAADLRSIEKLMEQMQKDEQTIQMVLMVGNALTGFGSSGVGLANWARNDFTDIVAGEILGPLKAAKLVMKLAVNLKKAVDRIRLFMTFVENNNRAKKAVSSLTSALTGFVERKETQIAFRTIEDALLIVQIASTIVGSVPEPFTMAIGKTMGAVTTAMQGAAEVTEFLFTEKKLAEAWETTINAMNNPRDRALGLAALRLNPTLAMHAIAWAGMKKQPPDPIARITLNDLGLNEQTLAVSGSERKVREFLALKLSEDGEMIDPDLIAPEWAPKNVKLTAEDWYVVTIRAARDAVPKLANSTERDIVAALRPLDDHKIDQWIKEAESGKADPAVVEKALAEANHARALLKTYSPITSNGSTHADMNNLGVKFFQLAKDYSERLAEVVDRNRRQRAKDEALTLIDLETQSKALDKCLNATEVDEVEKAVTDARMVVLMVQVSGLDEHPKVAGSFKNLVDKLGAIDKELKQMQDLRQIYPSFKSGIQNSWAAVQTIAQIKSQALTDALTQCEESLKKLVQDPKKTGDVVSAFGKLDLVIKNMLSEYAQNAGVRLYLRRLQKAASQAQT